MRRHVRRGHVVGLLRHYLDALGLERLCGRARAIGAERRGIVDERDFLEAELRKEIGDRDAVLGGPRPEAEMPDGVVGQVVRGGRQDVIGDGILGRDRDHGRCGRARTAADDHQTLVVLGAARREGRGQLRISLAIVGDELDFPSVDTAFDIERLDHHVDAVEALDARVGRCTRAVVDDADFQRQRGLSQRAGRKPDGQHRGACHEACGLLKSRTLRPVAFHDFLP